MPSIRGVRINKGVPRKGYDQRLPQPYQHIKKLKQARVYIPGSRELFSKN